jgi:hypothetical protein
VRHEARRGKLEGKLLPHSPKIGWRVHRASHVLSHTLDIVCVVKKSSTDVGEDCLGYHMCNDFIENILFQREVLDLIRLILLSETVNTETNKATYHAEMRLPEFS